MDGKCFNFKIKVLLAFKENYNYCHRTFENDKWLKEAFGEKISEIL